MVLEHARGLQVVQLPLVLLRFALHLKNEGQSAFWLHLFIDCLPSLSLFIYFTRHLMLLTDQVKNTSHPPVK